MRAAQHARTWVPSREEVAEDLRLHLEEARHALDEQKREHARLAKIRRAFAASLELRTRELELAVVDLNRCKRVSKASGRSSNGVDGPEVVRKLAAGHAPVARAGRKRFLFGAPRIRAGLRLEHLGDIFGEVRSPGP